MAVEEKPRGDALERLAQVGTYRTLGEQKLSPQEERFEKARRTIGLFLAPVAFLVFYLLPLDMDETQQKLAASLLFVVVLWISEAVPIPIGGLLGICLIVLIGVAPVDDVLAPFGSSTVFVFIGAFIIAQAMLRHGVAQAAGVDPFIPALAATFAASFGFMLPVSTPQNAIVYGSGVVPITQMVRNGFFFDVIGAT
jgi:solute carrier family 13 (sodium-dependent dicarboxylate transporter), member 2/3/5